MNLELLTQCKANNRQAQLQLYKQYAAGMFCVAMRFLQQKDDAEDVVQEAFIKAFRRLDQFKGEVTFGAWLKRIVINGCIDFLKAKREHLVSLDESYVQLAEEDHWEVKESISLDEVRKMIASLPEKYRYVVQLFLVEGYDHQEIAIILGISETASRTRLLRGKAKLKVLMEQINYGTGS